MTIDTNEFLKLKQRYKEISDTINTLSEEREDIVDGFLAVCNSCGTDNGQDCRACIWNIKATKDNLVDNWREE